ncbi:metallophosphoesterase [Halorubrum coriense DSM 10284]|uniref:Metallophosphoesterase n=1 Tax=Halorubrum coriense DSM 10284 TaxID=1227466 RepID=M0EAP0_9EURY|nr:metallophosphoesterase [Halorubrum coriense]ELZ43947.1 metallophosphoesterase [Halorubrum coriense DSM 10284]
MARVEPVVGEPAAVADLGTERALLVADVHAGIEVGLRYERGVELDSRADARHERLCGLVAETDADRLVVLGDLAHRIAAPDGDEREELETLIRAVTDRVPMTLVEGNHDAGVAEAFADDLDVIDAAGGSIGGGVAVCHGHTWPDPAIVEADVICTGHEHPQVRLEDAVGGSRVERAWLRGALDPAAFTESGERPDRAGDPPELVVFPAFNERSGGTWVNVDGQSFLAPYLPAALPAADAYLLDGTRLGDYRRV